MQSRGANTLHAVRYETSWWTLPASVPTQAASATFQFRPCGGDLSRLHVQPSRSASAGFGDFFGEFGFAFVELDDAPPGFFGGVRLAVEELLVGLLRGVVEEGKGSATNGTAACRG